MGFSPLAFSLKKPFYCAMPSDTLTGVKISKARDRPDAAKAKGSAHVMLPGMKQRMEIPRDPLIGQTIVLPTRFGSVITASSGTSTHSLSMRTR
jgi:hypothetical protein